jgi:hypothetical protein
LHAPRPYIDAVLDARARVTVKSPPPAQAVP